MNYKTLIFITLSTIFMAFESTPSDRISLKAGNFDIEKDLLLVHFDCKTDVDDLQTAAGLATLMSDSKFSNVRYHATAGTYGNQEGLYVPPNPLFELAFGDNWSDSHEDFKGALESVKVIVKSTLAIQGDIWIADAGQSDFTAELIRVIQAELPAINTVTRIHVIQHSDWNEKVTSPGQLDFVKKNADYHKIPDGNVVGNGTPGFKSPENIHWKNRITNPRLIEIWQLAIDLSNKYNGKDGRYLNKAIEAGGMDFSDLSEVCWILGLHDIKDSEHFFDLFSN